MPSALEAAPGARATALATLLAAGRAQLAALARAWLAAGATSYGLWSGGQPLACWPDDAPPGDGLTAVVAGPIELRLCGPTGEVAAARLRAEADLLGRLLGVEAELEDMTADLIERQDQLLALYDLARSFRSQLGLDAVLGTLAREAARLVGTAAASALLLTPAGPVVAHGGARPGTAPPIDDTTMLGLFEVPRADRRELLLQAGDLPDLLPPGVASLLCLPIDVRDDIAAGLVLVNKPGGFASPDVKLAQAIAEQAGRQIEITLLHEENLRQARFRAELDLAARIQIRLLPQRVPPARGLDVYARSHPALQVGGDFYDFITRPGHSWMFTVGDVAGKGMSAALMMSRIHAVIHNAAKFMPAPTPATVLRRVNEDLYDDFTEVGLFATTFLGQYEPESRTLRFANAGHAPVIHRAVGREPVLLEADGTAIGVLPFAPWADRALVLAPGDLVVAASDGLSEASDAAGAMFGHERLFRLTVELADLPARAIGEAILAAVEQFAVGATSDDDRTLVVIKGVPA